MRILVAALLTLIAWEATLLLVAFACGSFDRSGFRKHLEHEALLGALFGAWLPRLRMTLSLATWSATFWLPAGTIGLLPRSLRARVVRALVLFRNQRAERREGEDAEACARRMRARMESVHPAIYWLRGLAGAVSCPAVCPLCGKPCGERDLAVGEVVDVRACFRCLDARAFARVMEEIISARAERAQSTLEGEA